MNFGDAIKTCFNKYAMFEGRARRPELWWFFLFNVIAQMVGNWIHSILGMLVALALLLPSLAVGARRLHDDGRSGWWQLIGLIPVIGWLVLIYFFVQPGNEGANRFGPAPANGAAPVTPPVPPAA